KQWSRFVVNTAFPTAHFTDGKVNIQGWKLQRLNGSRNWSRKIPNSNASMQKPCLTMRHSKMFCQKSGKACLEETNSNLFGTGTPSESAQELQIIRYQQAYLSL